MIHLELEKEEVEGKILQYAVFTLDPIHNEVKFIFTEDYFQRLGCLVDVDSGDLQKGGGKKQKQRKKWLIRQHSTYC
jgi:hypothetical protein